MNQEVKYLKHKPHPKIDQFIFLLSRNLFWAACLT